MKDKNGIEIKCKNCANYGTYLFMPCLLCLRKNAGFKPTVESYEVRIAELQKELNIVQESERAEAQEADRLRAEVKELKAHNEVLQRRMEEFSMELLDYNMKENKDVLERLKQAEVEENAEEACNKRQEQFSLSDMELLRDIVEAKLKSVKRDDEYRCSLLSLSIKCMDIIKELKEGEY